MSTQEQNLGDFLALRVDEAQRRVYLTEELSAEALHDAARALVFLSDQAADPIELWISTNGGDLDATLGLLDVFDIVPSPIVTVGYGTVASAGALLLTAGDNRLVMPRTQVMLHGPQTPMVGTPPMPGYSAGLWDLEEELRQGDQELARAKWGKDQMAAVLDMTTSLTPEEIEQVLSSRLDTWWRGAEIIQAGLADAFLGG